MKDGDMTHTANFSMTVLEQVFSEWLVTPKPADLNLCKYLVKALTGFIGTINTICINLSTIFTQLLLIFQDHSTIMWSEIFQEIQSLLSAWKSALDCSMKGHT
jgi:hypothetical protein